MLADALTRAFGLLAALDPDVLDAARVSLTV